MGPVLKTARALLRTTAVASLALAAGVAVAALAADKGRAEDAPLISLDSWGASRGWEAVGVLEIESSRRCTGTLIAPDLVLTAAHCIYDIETSRATAPADITFRAGWRDGRSVASRIVAAAVYDTDYPQSPRLSVGQISADLALLRLDAPIPATHADPYTIDSPVRPGESVSVVSYGQGRYNAPSRQRSCDVAERVGPVKAFTCSAVPGSSGAPIFALRGHRPRIVAVVSAIAPGPSGQITLGMDVDTRVDRLKSRLRAGEGVTVVRDAPPTVRHLSVGGTRAAAGAKFVRPRSAATGASPPLEPRKPAS